MRLMISTMQEVTVEEGEVTRRPYLPLPSPAPGILPLPCQTLACCHCLPWPLAAALTSAHPWHSASTSFNAVDVARASPCHRRHPPPHRSYSHAPARLCPPSTLSRLSSQSGTMTTSSTC